MPLKDWINRKSEILGLCPNQLHVVDLREEKAQTASDRRVKMGATAHCHATVWSCLGFFLPQIDDMGRPATDRRGVSNGHYTSLHHEQPLNTRKRLRKVENAGAKSSRLEKNHQATRNICYSAWPTLLPRKGREKFEKALASVANKDWGRSPGWVSGSGRGKSSSRAGDWGTRTRCGRGGQQVPSLRRPHCRPSKIGDLLTQTPPALNLRAFKLSRFGLHVHSLRGLPFQRAVRKTGPWLG